MLGYAIVNFSTSHVADQALQRFDGFQLQGRTISAEWSDATQGLHSLVDKYRNSAIMHGNVAESQKPLLLCEGVPVVFPLPTKSLATPPCATRKPRRGSVDSPKSAALSSPAGYRSTVVTQDAEAGRPQCTEECFGSRWL